MPQSGDGGGETKGETKRIPLERGTSRETGKIFVAEKHRGEDARALKGWLRRHSVERARTHNNKKLDRQILVKIGKGNVDKWDTTTLNIVLVGCKGCVVKCEPKDRVVLTDEAYAERMALGVGEGGLEPWQVIRRVVGVRNDEMAHRYSSAMSDEEFKKILRIYEHALMYFDAPPYLQDEFKRASTKPLGLEGPGEGKTTFEERVIEYVVGGAGRERRPESGVGGRGCRAGGGASGSGGMCSW